MACVCGLCTRRCGSNDVYLSSASFADYFRGLFCLFLPKAHDRDVIQVYGSQRIRLGRHHMIKPQEPVEIYAREINEPMTLTLFLKSQLYGCWYDAGSRLPQAKYFAPHFGRSIAETHPGVHIGISYIARIEEIAVVGDWEDFINTVKSIRNGTWLNKHRDEVYALKNHEGWDWKSDRKRAFLFLGQPRLVFTPPVKKENLQSGKGWLSKRFLSFDELFAAWGC